MKKFLTIFFTTLGVLFFILIIIGAYLYLVDPLHLKPLFLGASVEVTEESEQVQTAETEEQPIDKNPVLTASQEKALETVGINPENVPTEITPEQEACFVERLGRTRVDEIAAGDAPSITEVLKAKTCLD